MTAPTSFLDGLRELNKPRRCRAGELFDKHLTSEEKAEFEAVARTEGANYAVLRRYFVDQTGDPMNKDTFSRHMREECSCE